MSVLKNIQKFCSGNRLVCLIGVVVLAVAIGSYSMNKSMVRDTMANPRQHSDEHAGQHAAGGVQASQPLGENADYQSVSGMNGGQVAPNCSRQSIQDPAALLPKDTNSEWARLNPSGQGNLNDVSLLKAGHHIGIDTVGQSLRNANLQVRSEPANPQLNVGPWNNTTMEPDTMRVPLEIGQGPQ